MNGEPFEPPPATAAWRVRKLKPKGAPEVVYGRGGLPLFLPLDADIDDLRNEVPPPSDGRYRLDPVDEHNRPVPGAQSSYVCVHPVAPTPEPAAPAPSAAAVHADMLTQLINALVESQKQHTEMARMYVGQFPVIANALSGVVRSAGDAGLPARVPLVVPVAPEVKPPEPPSGDGEDDQDAEDEDAEEVEIVESAPEPEWNWPRFAATALDRFSPAIESLVTQLPALGAVLGARRAKPATAKASEPVSSGPATDIMAHLNAILAALPKQEAAAAMTLVNQLSTAEQLAYVQKLRRMSVPEAVAYVRSELAQRARNGAHGSGGSEADDAPRPSVGMSEAEIDAHIDAIRAAMTPDESETVRVMFQELAHDHRLIWVEKLCRMSVPEGVAFLRGQLGEAHRDARARRAVDPGTVRAASAARSSAAPDAVPVRPTGPQPSVPIKPRRDGRRVAGSPVPMEQTSAAPTAPTSGAPTAGLGMTPLAQAHIDAIQRALSPLEDAAVRTYLAALPLAERSAWIANLLKLPVPEAVAMIRAQPLGVSADHVGTAAAVSPPAVVQPPTAPIAVAETAPLAVAETAPTRAAEIAPRNAAVPALGHAAEPALENLAMPTSATLVPVSTEATPPDERSKLAPALRIVTQPAPTAASPAQPTASSLDPSSPVSSPAGETNADAHLVAIELALTDAERFLVHARVAQMSPDERETLLDRLLSASVPEGAAILRTAIQAPIPQTPPVETQSPAVPVVSAAAPDDDAETLDDAGEPDAEAVDDAEELGDAKELEIEELDDDAQPDDVQPDGARPGDARPGESRARTDRGNTARTPAALQSAELPMLDPEASAHFKAINAALTFAERMRVFELGARLSPAELRGWIASLTSLSVAEGVARIRAAIAAADSAERAAKNGGVP